MRIGIDFDNTIVSYDHVFAAEARARGLIGDGFTGTKTEIRDHIRSLDDGELEWRRLQGRVYGALMAEARLIEGVDAFLTEGRNRNHEIFVVSHKTQFGHHDPDRVNLWDAALAWMTDKGFFDSDGFAIPKENVFFEPTRSEKIARIKALRCTHFIDDLEEIFLDPEFPANVQRFLLGPGTTWPAIAEAVFDA
ncbi:MAG: hypothetical protein CMM60_05705 [Rhodospirillaceae bacterium]|nr:hypothetical protein [Rhodospirillaceae bacterium]